MDRTNMGGFSKTERDVLRAAANADPAFAEKLVSLYKVTAKRVGADANSKIDRVWIKYGSQEVTQLPSGVEFEIHVAFRVSYDYIYARTPSPPLLPGPWGCAIIAMNMVYKQAASGWYDQPGPANRTIQTPDFNLGDNPFEAYGYTRPKMVDGDMVFIVFELCSLASNLDLPDPFTLALMSVQ